MDCTVWNEHHSTRLACRRPGPGAHWDRAGYGAERSQGSMHREVSMHESRPEQQRGREQWIVVSGTNTIGHGLHVADRAQGLTGT